MLCPIQNCIWDNSIQAGKAFCILPTCPYQKPRTIAAEVAKLLGQDKLAQTDKARLQALKAAYGRLLESG